MPEKPVGKVEHYYPKAKAAAVGLTDGLKVGDEIHIVGHGDDVRAKVKSLQLDHVPIQEGHAGQHIGVGLGTKVHEGDDVLLVSGGQPKAKPAARKAPARKARKAARKPKRAAAARRAKPRRAKATRRAKPRRAKAARRAKPKRAQAGKRKPAAVRGRKGKARKAKGRKAGKRR